MGNWKEDCKEYREFLRPLIGPHMKLMAIRKYERFSLKVSLPGVYSNVELLELWPDKQTVRYRILWHQKLKEVCIADPTSLPELLAARNQAVRLLRDVLDKVLAHKLSV